MGKKTSVYEQAIKILHNLKKEYPTYTLGQHISTALGEYKDVWNLPDKELLFALEKYEAEMELNIVSDIEVDKIVRDAQDLDKLFQEEEDNYD